MSTTIQVDCLLLGTKFLLQRTKVNKVNGAALFSQVHSIGGITRNERSLPIDWWRRKVIGDSKEVANSLKERLHSQWINPHCMDLSFLSLLKEATNYIWTILMSLMRYSIQLRNYLLQQKSGRIQRCNWEI